MAALALGLAFSSLALLVLGGVVAGLGQGLTFRAGLAAVNTGAPAERRAEVASSYFVVMYVALAIPVIGEGVLARASRDCVRRGWSSPVSSPRCRRRSCSCSGAGRLGLG